MARGLRFPARVNRSRPPAPTALLLFALGLAGCGGAGPLGPGADPGGVPPGVTPPPPPPPPPAPAPTYDWDRLGAPRFVTHDYIDLGAIQRISLFRSSVGHSAPDQFESCRSLKHYYMPFAAVDWGTVAITAPVAGTVTRIVAEWAGSQIQIRSALQPAFVFILFHVTPTVPLTEGAALTAGQPIGRHVGSQTFSDIAVRVDTPTGWRMVSFAELMTDGLWAGYQARGLANRSDLIIPRALRDQHPLTCQGETFTGSDPLPQWVTLP